jgi:hypothetical protein
MPFDVASGYVGNMMAESIYTPTSGINPTAKSPSDGRGRFAYGSSQWRAGRKTKLQNYLESYGLSMDSLPGQLRFMLEEVDPESSYRDPTSAQNHAKMMELYNQGVFGGIDGITNAVEGAFYRADPRTVPGFDPSNEADRNSLKIYNDGMNLRRKYAKMINDLGAEHFGGANNNFPPNPNKKASLINQLTGSLGGLLGGGNNDGINWGGLAMGANAMSMFPDPTLNQAIALRQQNQKEANKLAQGQTRLQKYIDGMPAGPMKDKYMAMLQSNIDPNDIFKDMIQNRSKLFDQTSGLRDEFEKRKPVAYWNMMSGFYEDLIGKVESPGGATDMAIVFRYMKLLDPTSAVREKEYATAANIGGVPAWIGALFNHVKGSGQLEAGQRAEFLRASKVLYDGAKERYQNEVENYTGLVDSYDMDVNQVIIQPKIDEEKIARGDKIIDELVTGRNNMVDFNSFDLSSKLSDIGVRRDFVEGLVEEGLLRDDELALVQQRFAQELRPTNTFSINELKDIYEMLMTPEKREKFKKFIENYNWG